MAKSKTKVKKYQVSAKPHGELIDETFEITGVYS